jgi:hypothetical protein
MVQVILLIHHLRRLGYRAELDGSMEQPTCNACGYVAALAAALLSEGDWKEADVSLAVHPNIISMNARASWLKLVMRVQTMSALACVQIRLMRCIASSCLSAVLVERIVA